jgi:hypothetical protein
MEEGDMRQVVTETDFMRAVYDYMAEQLEGRFKLEFPEGEEMIDLMVDSLRDETLRMDAEYMTRSLKVSLSTFGAILTDCMLSDCDNGEYHDFAREFINLVWDSRQLTQEWLKGQGVVPGRSAN